jgi:hypothetical protein
MFAPSSFLLVLDLVEREHAAGKLAPGARKSPQHALRKESWAPASSLTGIHS